MAHISEVGMFTGMVTTSDEVYHIEVCVCAHVRASAYVCACVCSSSVHVVCSSSVHVVCGCLCSAHVCVRACLCVCSVYVLNIRML